MSFSTRERGEVFILKMDSDIRYEVSLQFFESLTIVASNIDMLNKKIHNMIVSIVRGKMGNL